MGQTIVWETKRHEEDMDILSSKLRALQSELSAVTHEKSILETKLIELDQLVGQLLSVNESLVVRLSGKPLPKGSQLKATTVKKKKVVAQPQSRSTIPLRLSASAQGALNDVKNLHGMHKMYVDLAHSITDPHATISLKKVRRSSSSGEVTGKQLKSSTLIKSKKIQGERSYEESNSNGNMNVRIPYVTRQNNDESIYDGQNLSTSQSGGFRSTQNGDLQVVINSLEEEFEVLNDQYHNLLTSVQSQSSSEATHAEGLVAVIQKLHKKGEQLRALKSPPRRDR